MLFLTAFEQIGRLHVLLTVFPYNYLMIILIILLELSNFIEPNLITTCVECAFHDETNKKKMSFYCHRITLWICRYLYALTPFPPRFCFPSFVLNHFEFDSHSRPTLLVFVLRFYLSIFHQLSFSVCDTSRFTRFRKL